MNRLNHAYKIQESGIALFIAIIFASVVLLIGVALASFGYKQVILSSSAVNSQKAFYAADSSLECILYADQQFPSMFQGTALKSFSCGGMNYSFTGVNVPGYYKYNIQNITNSMLKTCADVVVYKTDSPSVHTTYIFSTGYYNVGSVNCSVNTHTTIRGIDIKYGS